MIYYYKPRTNLEFSSILLPQKVKILKRVEEQHRFKDGRWEITAHNCVSYRELATNFTRVDSEREAIEGY